MFRDPEPILTIRTPNGKLDATGRAFLHQKADWILEQYHRQADLYAYRQAFLDRIYAGEALYRGKWYKVVTKVGRQRKVQVLDEQIVLQLRPADADTDRKMLLFEAFRALARQVLAKRTGELARETGSEFNRLVVKHVVSKWGSCSSKRNLNLNWHLIFLPQHLIDYIIIHELMHLREMNHSKAYWKEVAKYYPNHKAAQKEVHSYGWLIGILV